MNTTYEQQRRQLWIDAYLETLKKVTVHELRIVKDVANAALKEFDAQFPDKGHKAYYYTKPYKPTKKILL